MQLIKPGTPDRPDAGVLGDAASQSQTFRLALPVEEKPGTLIGRYKLLQKIGEGGCGTVYMAEQEQPVRRRVALKVIKLGMDTKQVITRFEAERQAVAMMEHPNIAKVFDAGASETGRPYFVMELVRGLKVTDYCDQHNLPTARRLKLFVQVCQAVQHAHQKGIIHRDLKPSNILVTVNDGVPVPKVIDFGIAKAAQGRLTDQTVFTAFEQFIGTPAYMSPEQAELTSLDIDTRSDIYSLGVLLYELLTGTIPFDTAALLKAGLDAMRRVIREEEPMRPSTRLGTMAKAELTTAAKRRQLEPPKLILLVRGDLDWIVMKCLEKDRSRRYETANGLAKDLERYLNDEPIIARPPTKWYRLKKAVRRNRLAFGSASAIATALVIGLTCSIWMFLQEKAARQRAVAAEQEQERLRRAAELDRGSAEANEKKARSEAGKSHQVAGFLEATLKQVGQAVTPGPNTGPLRKVLDQTAERVGNDMTNQPDVEIQLRTALANTYHEMGFYKQMEEMARINLRLAQLHFGSESKPVADALNLLGDALMHQFDIKQAESLHRQALELNRRLLGNDHLDVAGSLGNLGTVLEREGNFTEAEAVQREALGIRQKLLGNDNLAVAGSLSSLGLVLEREGNLSEAENLHRAALGIAQKLLGNENQDVATSLHNLAHVLERQDRLTEAETMQREALAMRRKLLSDEHPAVATSLNNLGIVLAREGKLLEAELTQREALAMRQKLFGNSHPAVATSLNSLAMVLRDQNELAAAETMLREALDMTMRFLDSQHPDVATSLNNLVDVLKRQGRYDAANALLERTTGPGK